MITQKQLNNAVNAIVEGYSPDRVILFGSYAVGCASEYSDVDLLIIKDDTNPTVKRNRIVRHFLKDMKIPVDIIVKTNEEFEKYKDIVGTVVYSANKYGKILYE